MMLYYIVKYFILFIVACVFIYIFSILQMYGWLYTLDNYFKTIIKSKNKNNEQEKK